MSAFGGGAGISNVPRHVALSEALPRGPAAQLTSWRGERWTKELDYLYLGLGVLGLTMSLGKIENVSDKFDAPGTLGAGLVATTLVLRTIKTRAEIAGWNKQKNNGHRGQLSAAVAAIKEKGVLTGKRIERSEIGTPCEFDHL
jgi:hypothetical protein